MGRDRNTFEKMRREMEKKRKANEKRERKKLKKQEAANPVVAEAENLAENQEE